MSMVEHAKEPHGRGEAWRVSVIQSNYIPWKGFFDLIGRCDEYIIFDSVGYAKRHWHNRNKVMTPSGPIWVTIPVKTKSRFVQPIEEVEVAGAWAEKHWRTIEHNYRRAPYFSQYGPRLQHLYEQAANEPLLTRINELFLRNIAEILSLNVMFSRDHQYTPEGARSGRVLSMCVNAGATHYLSGPSAKGYLETDKFVGEGIIVEWMQYEGYAIYPQLGPSFDHAVTALDLIFNTGPDAERFCKAPLESRSLHARLASDHCRALGAGSTR